MLYWEFLFQMLRGAIEELHGKVVAIASTSATGPPDQREQSESEWLLNMVVVVDMPYKPEQDTITRQVAALEADLLTQQQQARASTHQPPGPPQDKQPHAQSTMYRTKVSSGLEGARSQAVTGSNAMEQRVAHPGSNPEAAMTVDNDTTGVDDNLDEENPGKIAPNVDATGKEVEGDTMRMVVDNEEGRHEECTRPSMVCQPNRKGNSLHEPMSHSPRSPFPVVRLVPNWHSTKVHLAVPTQSQPNSKTSNSKAGSQHCTDRSTSNPDGLPQDGYKSLYGGLNDGDDANNAHAQVLYTSSMPTSRNPYSPHALASHLTLNSCANMESERGCLTVDKHRVGSGDGDHDYDGYRGDNVGSDWDECSSSSNNDDDNNNNNNNNNNNDDNNNGNNGDAPAPTCTTSCAVEQSGLNARAFKKGPSNSFKPVVRVFNHSLTCKVPSMEQPGQQVWKPGPSQNWASGVPSHMQGHSHRAVEADEENFETFHLVTILIISEVKQQQCTYDWHSELATHALKAVKVFFDQYEEVDTTEAQAAYVAWAVLEVTEIVDAHGHVKPVAPSLFPYMWERVDEGPDSPIPKGTFQHDCILDTFTFYLESTSIIKPSVERAFWAWSVGQYVPLPKAQQRFSQALWGYATNEVMEPVDCLSAKQWKRILLGAEKYVGAYHPQPTLDVLVAKLRKLSGRAMCFEPNSE
ncbi:hypothetical protein EDC04DRAFT_2612306 [Pisolithus marmoratus]|nr:hypothetical protein EDC04DRAFT_2612306 [Pisolithus marmoratus]